MPAPFQRAIVLASVKTKPAAALNRAGLDRRCARRHSDQAAGTGECSAGPNKRMWRIALARLPEMASDAALPSSCSHLAKSRAWSLFLRRLQSGNERNHHLCGLDVLFGHHRHVDRDRLLRQWALHENRDNGRMAERTPLGNQCKTGGQNETAKR
jgi:hypothetical protein